MVPEKDKSEYVGKLIVKIGKEDDKKSLVELYDYIKNDIYSYALFILKNKEDAEDVLQETFTKLYEVSPDFVLKGNSLAWIFKITRNICYMKIRKNKKQVDVEEYFFDSLKDEYKFDTDESIVLKGALFELNDIERNIIILHIYYGFKHREISKIINIPLATTLSKYNRSLKKLKKILSEGEKNEK